MAESERETRTPETRGQIRSFRDLVAWQRAMRTARLVYEQTEVLPPRERFSLASQMNRAAVSVPSNIAEGYARGTTAEFLRFLWIARGSLAEVDTQVELAADVGLIAAGPDLNSAIAETDRVLRGLIRSLEQLPPSERKA